MDLTFFTTQNFFSRVISFRYLTARRARAFGLLVSTFLFMFSVPASLFFPLLLFGLWMAYGVVWDRFSVMGNTIGVRVFENCVCLSCST